MDSSLGETDKTGIGLCSGEFSACSVEVLPELDCSIFVCETVGCSKNEQSLVCVSDGDQECSYGVNTASGLVGGFLWLTLIHGVFDVQTRTRQSFHNRQCLYWKIFTTCKLCLKEMHKIFTILYWTLRALVHTNVGVST